MKFSGLDQAHGFMGPQPIILSFGQPTAQIGTCQIYCWSKKMAVKDNKVEVAIKDPSKVIALTGQHCTLDFSAGTNEF
jgi:hypothetical protein